MGDKRDSRGGADGERPSPKTTALSAPRDLSVRARVDSHDGLLDLQAEIVDELLHGDCTDNRVRALQAAQRGLTICREIVTDRDELAQTESLDRNVSSVNRQLEGQGGGLITADQAPAFNPPGGATH